MRIKSDSIKNKQLIADKYSGQHDNVFPHLKWGDAPKGTRSYAIICTSPNAPASLSYWHFMAFNISKKTTEIKEGRLDELKDAILLPGDIGLQDYFGPDTPSKLGVFEYEYKIYALPFADLEEFLRVRGFILKKNSSKEYIKRKLEAWKLASSKITALYKNTEKK